MKITTLRQTMDNIAATSTHLSNAAMRLEHESTVVDKVHDCNLVRATRGHVNAAIKNLYDLQERLEARKVAHEKLWGEMDV